MSYRLNRVSNRSELNDFINLPFEIYRNDKNWVAPIKSELKRTLDVKKNPYFRFASLALFNCYRNKNIVARISLSVNETYCKKVGVGTGFFGFFEAFNDPDAVKFLFDEVFKYCRANGIQRVEGPFNPNLYSEVGMLRTNFELPPSFFQTYNPEYYNSLLKENGFNILEVLHTRVNKNSSDYLNKKFRGSLELQMKDLRVRSFNMKNRETDLEHLRNIFNDAFSDNWHFTPVNKNEYLFASKYLELVTPPDLLQFVEFKGEPVAAVHFVLDINPLLKNFKGKSNLIKYLNFLIQRKNIDKALVFAVGIKREYRNSRVVQLLFNTTIEISRKFRILESTWMYDENKIILSLAERLGLERDKEFNIYYKNLPS